MKMAARELLRRPRSFLVPSGILLLLALLLLYPSAVLDGLYQFTTGALRNAPADLIVYSEDAKSSLLRSRIDPALRDQIAAVDGVAETAAFDVTLLSGRVEGRTEPVGLAVLASERPFGGVLPGPGKALADSSLREKGLDVGDEVVVGPFRVPVTVTGWVSDTNLMFQSGFVVDVGTWRQTVGQAPLTPTDPAADGSAGGAAASLPPDGAAAGSGDGAAAGASAPTTAPGDPVAEPPTAGGPVAEAGAPGGTTPDPAAAPVTPAAPAAPAEPPADDPNAGSQTVFVMLEAGADAGAVADAIDAATDGTTRTVTRSEAVASLPGQTQQATTFGYIRGVTLVVALLVVGLFLSFVTLERAPLYAVLKAIGMSSRQLFSGVITQVLLMTITAVVVAAGLTWALTQVPLELPTVMRPQRLVETLIALGITSIVGSVLSLRRMARIDPASAIG